MTEANGNREVSDRGLSRSRPGGGPSAPGSATRPFHTIIALCAAMVATGLGEAKAAGAELLMLEQSGCAWCARWDQEIGPIYPKTEEGRCAPLRRVDIHGTWPTDLDGVSRGKFTPTFVLITDGREVGRITGYPGEDFFWGLLAQMIRDANPDDGGFSCIATKETQP